MRVTRRSCPEHDDCLVALYMAAPGEAGDQATIGAPQWAQDWTLAQRKGLRLVGLEHIEVERNADKLLVDNEYVYPAHKKTLSRLHDAILRLGEDQKKLHALMDKAEERMAARQKIAEDRLDVRMEKLRAKTLATLEGMGAKLGEEQAQTKDLVGRQGDHLSAQQAASQSTLGAYLGALEEELLAVFDAASEATAKANDVLDALPRRYLKRLAKKRDE